MSTPMQGDAHCTGLGRLEKDKDQLSLTNPRDALHHGKRAANK